MLMAQIHAQLAASYSNNEGGCDIEGIGADLKAEQDFFDDSCFECPGSLDVFQTPTIGPASIADNAGKNSIFQSANINLDGAKIYTDSTPLNESLTMKCSGTLTVFLNEVHKIYKYEFLYIAMETV